jgi:hypothetical protein
MWQGDPFIPAYSFGSDNDMLACLTQGQAQDVFWFDQYIKELRDTRLPAYFVPKGDESAKVFFAVIPRSDTFMAHFKEPWSRMVQSEYFTLLLYHNHDVPAVEGEGGEGGEEGETGEKPNRLRACIVPYPAGRRELTDHVKPDKYPNDLVLAVRCSYPESLRLFGDRGAAQVALEVCLPTLCCLGHRGHFRCYSHAVANWISGQQDSLELCFARLRRWYRRHQAQGQRCLYFGTGR